MTNIVPSEELRAFLSRVYAIYANGDDDAIRQTFSNESYLVMVGTDPQECRKGPDAVEVWVRQVREVGDFSFTPRNTSAFVAGNVGWIFDQPLVKIGSSVEVPFRLTMVVALERGQWRIVHWHSSIGQRNEDSIGLSLTTSIDAIEKSVRDDRPDMARASAPDGTVTILFTDIESSTVLMERLGDTDFLRMLSWHDRVIRDVSREHRGFVVKSQGDGFMLAFPSAAFALRAALVIRERIAAGFNGLPIRVRAGLHAGEAIKRDEDFYGRTVVIAARISALALGDEILASHLVHALAGSLGTFEFGPERRATLKGLDGTFGLYPLIR